MGSIFPCRQCKKRRQSFRPGSFHGKMDRERTWRRYRGRKCFGRRKPVYLQDSTAFKRKLKKLFFFNLTLIFVGIVNTTKKKKEITEMKRNRVKILGAAVMMTAVLVTGCGVSGAGTVQNNTSGSSTDIGQEEAKRSH